MKKVLLSLILPVLFMLSACGTPDFNSKGDAITKESDDYHTQEKDNYTDKFKNIKSGTNEGIEIKTAESAADVIIALRDYDMEKLSQYVHPEKGVRFTPYGYVDIEKDLVLSRDEIKSIDQSAALYLWGSYDGTGDPIKLSFEDYYREFVYDADFINAEELNVSNTELESRGNALDNSFEVYKNSIILEFYFSGFDPQYEGMDWKSLRLVFEKLDGSWYLAGIIHNQWTI